MQCSLRTPQAGRWTLVLAPGTQNPGRLQESFTGTIDFTPASITVDNLPRSASARLAAGQPVGVTVHVTNTGGQPEARLRRRAPHGAHHLASGRLEPH